MNGLLQETIVLLSADIFNVIYEQCNSCYGDAAQEIIRLAENFEKELDWQEDDQRDYIEELEKYEKKVLLEYTEC